MVGVDTAKDAIYARLRISTPGPGYCHFPVSYNETYFKQLTSEKVRTKFVKGFPVREWYKEQGIRNEALDRRVYAMCALHSRTVLWEVFARHAPAEPPSQKEQSAAKSVPAPPSTPMPPRGRKVR
jgi:phage terminase large subunit GpA-like protein